MASLRVGILGLTHDHVWQHVPELMARGDVSLSVAEPTRSLAERARRDFGVERVYSSYADLLDREEPDAVLIFVDNAGTAPLVEMAAARRIPVMIEKPMADCLANADRMRVAARSAGTPLMVNWPTAWNPAIRHALDLARQGLIGEAFRFSFRGGHAGPREFGCSEHFCDWLYDPKRNGAGAYIDYSGYGASLARLLFGMPSRVQATIGRLRKEDIDVDDNAVLVLRYPKALATIEATWSVAGPVPDGGPVIWGSQGTLIVRRPYGRREGEVATSGQVLHLTPDRPEGEVIDPPDLPEGESSATSYFLTCLTQGRPIEGLVSLEVGRDTQEILEAGLRSSRQGQEISLPLDR